MCARSKAPNHIYGTATKTKITAFFDEYLFFDLFKFLKYVRTIALFDLLSIFFLLIKLSLKQVWLITFYPLNFNEHIQL